ncbi:MAG: 5-dehydro-4-deoxy-D-glucuronate isomerase [Saprospiraceae bacterium]|nr:5-dehydro-4-deoxy-D-glucuronate isomerase [Saprospiraceae bacterium]
MQTRYESSPNEVKGMTTGQLRENFLIDNCIVAGEINFVYSHYDRMIIGGAMPTTEGLALGNFEQLKADYFLERREMGIINIGGDGTITADGKTYNLRKLDCVYLGKGTKDVVFSSNDAAAAAQFYILSVPAHRDYPNRMMPKEEASPMTIGSPATANHRTVYKYIHADGIKSCQLVMGLTTLHTGSVWNTMPAHTHDRRMEAYFYFDVPSDQAVVHFMGQPQETRHIFMANHQAVISPPWSIHSGCGTTNYGFIWGMGGENFNYTDMDVVAINALR